MLVLERSPKGVPGLLLANFSESLRAANLFAVQFLLTFPSASASFGSPCTLAISLVKNGIKQWVTNYAKCVLKTRKRYVSNESPLKTLDSRINQPTSYESQSKK